MATFEGGPSLRQRRAVPLPSLLAEQCFESLDRRRRDLCYLQRRLPGSITRAPGRGSPARRSTGRRVLLSAPLASERAWLRRARAFATGSRRGIARLARAVTKRRGLSVDRYPPLCTVNPIQHPGCKTDPKVAAPDSRYADVDSRSDGSPKWLPTIGLAEA